MSYLLDLNLGKNNGRSILADFYFPKYPGPFPVVIFCHGFKGFKNWGPWSTVAKQFVNAGFAFLTFNFSHNGIGEKGGIDFEDLAGFAQNTYSKELLDLETVVKSLQTNEQISKLVKAKEVYLIGHSRGGGIALTYAAYHPILKVATWASISTFNRFGSKEELALWKKEGVKTVLNARTMQEMPMNYSIYEDYLQNEEKLDLKSSVKNMKQPLLVIHGSADTAVGYSHALRLVKWHRAAQALEVVSGNHVFNTTHPFKGSVLPPEMQMTVEKTISFFRS